MRSWILWIGGAVLLVLAIMLWRTGAGERATDYVPRAVAYQPDSDQLARLLTEAITYRTISFKPGAPTAVGEFRKLHALLRRAFPRVHRELTRETINDYSLLYHWKGSGSEEQPVLTMGHMDVVPIAPGTEQDWVAPPFSGARRDGFVWGRGASDDKSSVLAQLAAVEALLQQGYTPKRDIYLAFGHDEEIGGDKGALATAQLLKQRGVRLDFVLDEGGSLTENVVPGARVPIAIISIAEKGYVTLELAAKARGGHSSSPTRQSAIGILAAAITALEADPFPTDFAETGKFMRGIADAMEFPRRFLFKNTWAFAPFLEMQARRSRSGRALMHTTTAVTVLNAGVKANVLPHQARALVNFRIYPTDSIASVIARVRDVIDDERVEIAIAEGILAEPSPVAPAQGAAWDFLAQAIYDTAAPQEILVAPRLLPAATDSRHYRIVTDKIYRFNFTRYTPDDYGRVHGTNERMREKDMVDSVRFYVRLYGGL